MPKTLKQKFLEEVDKNGPEHPTLGKCWIWKRGKIGWGYGQCRVLGERRAHRASYKLMVGQIPEGLRVLHRCDVPACVNPDHLFLGTNLDNSADMVAKGRQATGDRNGARAKPENLARGDNHPNRVLSEALVRRIRLLHLSLGYGKISKMLNVSKASIARVIQGKTWGHVV